jgi:tetratricopeptide (TPR) repeat protein
MVVPPPFIPVPAPVPAPVPTPIFGFTSGFLNVGKDSPAAKKTAVKGGKKGGAASAPNPFLGFAGATMAGAGAGAGTAAAAAPPSPPPSATFPVPWMGTGMHFPSPDAATWPPPAPRVPPAAAAGHFPAAAPSPSSSPQKAAVPGVSPSSSSSSPAADSATATTARHASLISTARSLYASSDFAAAHKKFTDALALKPNDSTALSNRAACAMMLGRHFEAVADCARATDLDPSYAPAYLRCSRAYLALGELHAAIEQAEASISASNVMGGTSGEKQRTAARSHLAVLRSIEAQEARALSNLHGPAFGVVVDALDRAAGLHTDAKRSLTAASLRARALIALARYEEAAEACASALPPQLEGSNEVLACRERPSRTAVETAVVFAFAVWCCEDPDRAARILSAVLRAAPGLEDAEILASRISKCEAGRKQGNELYRAGDYTGAIRVYTLALVAAGGDPTDPRPGLVEEDEDMELPDLADEGVADYPCAPARANLFCNRAAGHMSRGEFGRAVEDCDEALRVSPRHLKSRLRRGRAQVALADWTEAVSDLSATLPVLRAGQGGVPPGGRVEATVEQVAKELREAEEQLNRQAQERERERRERERRERRWGGGGDSYRYSGRGSGRGRGGACAYDDDGEGYYNDDGEHEDEEESEEDDSSSYRRGGWGGGGTSSHHHTRGGRTGGPSFGGFGAGARSGRAPVAPPPPPRPPKPTDHYAVLGVAVGVAEAEVRRAYKAKALTTHPDKGGSEEAFKLVGEAYAVLMDATRRAAHDAEVAAWVRRYGGR